MISTFRDLISLIIIKCYGKKIPSVFLWPITNATVYCHTHLLVQFVYLCSYKMKKKTFITKLASIKHEIVLV